MHIVREKEGSAIHTHSRNSFQDPGRSDLPGLLSEAQNCAADPGEAFSGSRQRLLGLAERLQTGRFHLAVLGQFKRGKSTLLNALLGVPVLPAGVVPLTAIPTFLKFGEKAEVSVSFREKQDAAVFEADGIEKLRSFLAGYVAEERNPQNRLGVANVEVRLPVSLLRNGVVFIDTPGIGSTLRHNTEATLNLLPQCDAAMFVVSADPPVTEAEIEFLRRVKEKIPRLIFVLNKIDYLDSSERKAAVEFFRKTLTEQLGIDPGAEIFVLSAKKGLLGKKAEDRQQWEESGVQALESHLVDFLVNEKNRALTEAVAGKAADVVSEMLMCLRLEKQSLELPLEDLRRRMDEFGKGVEKVQRQRQEAKDLLSGDSRRLLEFLEEHSAVLRETSGKYLAGIVEGIMNSCGEPARWEEKIQKALDEAIPCWFEHQSGKSEELFRKRISEEMEVHRKRADGLVSSIRQTAAAIFDIPYRSAGDDRTFEIVRRPYWVTRKWSSGLSPAAQSLADRFLPETVRKGRLRKRLREQIDALVISNVENMRWSLYQSIADSFRNFGAALDARLTEAIEGIRRAAAAATEQRALQGEAVRTEKERLRLAIEKLEGIEEGLSGMMQP